ncbi:hypothetical protein DFH09DRAFT_1303817 [Mycena vulgaris]|nr:hypothetical protein DFH09DRAFT_1303817 [Mycena vulgaris]
MARVYKEIDSPVRHLLHTNFVPSDIQCDGIRALLSESLKSLDEMDAEITRLRATLAKLVQQREQIWADISAHQAIITPARRLPRDIIQEIFVACLPTDRNSVIVLSDAPILLGQICSAWRVIALSTPCLWSSLHVVIPGKVDKVRRVSETIKVWLSRSGALPLSITVVMSRTFDDTVSATEIFAALSLFSRRWNNIQFLFALASDSLMESLALIRTEDVPLLENILMCSWIKDPTAAVPLPILAAPSLRGASINFFGHRSVLPIDWHSLTELHLNTGNRSGHTLGFMAPDGEHMGATTYLSAHSAIVILRCCPNLTTVSLELTHDYSEDIHIPDDHTLFGPPVALSKLKSFSVAFPHRRPRDAFFDALVLPQLQSFEFTGCIGKNLKVPFSSVLKGTSSLIELAISLRRFRLEPILEMLTFTSDITKLKLANLESMGWGSWFPEENTVLPHEELLNLLASDTGLVCPCLTSIEFDRCTLFSDAGLLKFLKRRLGNEDGTVPLKKFRAVFTRGRELDLEPDLQLFMGQDVTVSLSYPPAYRPPPPQPYSPWEGITGPIPYFNHEDAWPTRWH